MAASQRRVETALPRLMAQSRLLSLDVMRGITVAGMILVNSPGNERSYAALKHAVWHGWTPADFVFPSFLFVMGASLAISLGRRLEHAEPGPPGAASPPRSVWRHVFQRSVIIFALGLLSSFVAFQTPDGMRFAGVLQRIAACYLFSSLIFLKTRPPARGLAAALMLVVYWLLMTFVPVPGAGSGVRPSPGVLTPEGNLASYLDRLMMGRRLLGVHYDPEGILSTIPAVATTLSGVLVGPWLLRGRQPSPWARQERMATGFIAMGAIGVAAGLTWGIWFPINKNIWTSSFALFNIGLALGALGLCYWLIEVRGFTRWARPFEIFGRNPLLAYFLAGLFYVLQGDHLRLRLCACLFETWLSAPNASLAYALSYLLLCLGFMAYLHKRKIFLKI